MRKLLNILVVLVYLSFIVFGIYEVVVNKDLVFGICIIILNTAAFIYSITTDNYIKKLKAISETLEKKYNTDIDNISSNNN